MNNTQSVFMQKPQFIYVALRDFIYYFWLLNNFLANIFIRPLKYFEARRLKEEIKKGTIKKVLVNRSDQIGDAVVSLKFINALANTFEEVCVVVSKKNRFVFEHEKKIKIIEEKEKALHEYKTIFDKFFFFTINFFPLLFQKQEPKYDLVIDLISDVSIKRRYPARYIIGANRGVFSLLYTNFYKTSLSLANKQLMEAYKEMIKDCLGLELNIADGPPPDFSQKKEEQIFIFVGNKAERNLSYEKWREIILELAKIKRCVVADDPEQKIMEKLKEDYEIRNNKQIQLIEGPRKLSELAEFSNKSKLFIGLDGGGEHYLEQYTNALIIYTCGLPSEWKPYSLNPYNKFVLKNEHIVEKTITSTGLKKYIFYRVDNRKPCYDLLCNYKKFKEIDVYLIADIVREFFS